ncbi:DUF4386 domain-containing protein [Spirochaeta dissipatitropha]
MKNYRINSIMAGALYILGTVAGVLSVIVVGGFPDQNFISRIAGNPSTVMVGALLILIMGISLASMTLFLYPLFRRDSEPLALGMLVFRGTLEGAWYLLTALFWVTMGIISSQIAVVESGREALEALGTVVIEAQDKLGNLGSIIFLIGAVCLYISFYRTKLIPRWLSIWGLISVIPYLIHTLLLFFEVQSTFILFIPLAVQEMVMGGWLIIAGFNIQALEKLMGRTQNRP